MKKIMVKEMALLFEQLVVKNNTIINEIDLMIFKCRMKFSFTKRYLF
jgi:hypothetical protein